MTAKRSISVYHLQRGRRSGQRKTYLREHGLGSFRDPTIALHVPVGKQKGGNRSGRNRSGGGQSDASSQHTIVNSTPTIVSQNECTTRIWVNIGRTLHVQQRLPALRTIAAVLARRTKDPAR